MNPYSPNEPWVVVSLYMPKHDYEAFQKAGLLSKNTIYQATMVTDFEWLSNDYPTIFIQIGAAFRKAILKKLGKE